MTVIPAFNAFWSFAFKISTLSPKISRVAGTGAYTGEVSAELLKDSQINFVLVGH
ncbi:triose-phosphate isomerase, partial [Acinetobacter baumannii]|uniref:triose-phosphate isomerase n=1 Tax=Acinetobacter baumannii TaxID=470 RepID=UPI001489267D